MTATHHRSSRTFALVFSFVVALFSIARAQYALGVRLGPSTFLPLSSSGAKATESLSGLVVSAALQLLPDEGTGHRFTLDHVIRVFDIDQIHGFTGRREEQTIRSTFIQLTSAVRSPLGKGSHVYFDFGPSIGAQVSEHRTGIAFYDYPPGQEDTLFVDERTTGIVINDIRLRLGLSADLLIAERLYFNACLNMDPGWSDWFRSKGYITVEAQVLIGISYALAKGPVRGPKDVEPATWSPRIPSSPS